MNSQQLQAVNLASHGHNLLMLGSAGTGKSNVVSDIANVIHSKGLCVQVTCSTGIACAVYGHIYFICLIYLKTYLYPRICDFVVYLVTFRLVFNVAKLRIIKIHNCLSYIDINFIIVIEIIFH